MFNEDDVEVLSQVVRSRKTLKVLRDTSDPVEISQEVADKNRPLVMRSIELAGWAPFHYARGLEGIPEPWRFHVLWHDECRHVAKHFHEWFADAKPSNKLPMMLAACGALVLVNWICLLYTSPSPRDATLSRMPSSA